MNKLTIITCIFLLTLIFNTSLTATPDKILEKNLTGYDFIVDEKGNGDYTKIQDAICAASNGETILIKNGIYKENLVISKSIKLIGEDKHKTIIDGGIEPTFFKKCSTAIKIEKDNVEISNITIQNATGLSGRGIYVIKNKGRDFTENNTITNNIIKNCSYGLMIVKPKNNSVSNNSFYNCAGGFYYPKLPYYQNTFSNNTANERLILLLIDKEDMIIEENYSVIQLLDCKNITIKNISTSHITVGIDVSFSENITITNCTIKNTNRGGIYVHYSNNCKFIKNTFEDDNWGVFLRGANNNQMINNNFLNITKYDWFGSSYNNRWDGNFWEKERIFPKVIYGKIGPREKTPWFNIDWNPSSEIN